MAPISKSQNSGRPTRKRQPDPRLHLLLRATADRYGYTIKALTGPRKHARLASARITAMYVARTKFQASYPAIGAVFHKHHTTVMYDVKRAQAQLDGNPAYADEVAKLEARLDVLLQAHSSDTAAA